MITRFTDWLRRVLGVLPHPIRWVATLALGFLLLIVGLIFMLIPGPGIPFVLAGLALLSLEFVWAQEALKNGEQWLEKLVHRLKSMFKPKS